ncbi:MAP-homologous protein [Lachnellula occidentalis]|uniref:MAP-homologous protein n=1 Tax=Lachnellula occidentalis TaxID=215460 RepID=A0A8H8U8I1_9HELO|nr:MAP-homologous protein [Lachnellula occidentalis]
MERLHGVDISWMTNHSSTKDHSKPQPASPISANESKSTQNSNAHAEDPPSAPKTIPRRPSLRSGSSEKTATLNGSSTSPTVSRRNSWLSSISSKFSPESDAQETPVPAGPSAPKNAILQPGAKGNGDAPYVPAQPKSAQPNFLQSALRRLSSSGGVQMNANHKGPQHGLCERKVLNVDQHRERCRISDLDLSKLRRVAFCVDVEIASGPRYHDDDSVEDKERKEKKIRVAEQGEGDALKHPQEVKNEKEEHGAVKGSNVELSKEPPATTNEVKDDSTMAEKDSKKKEKKKRSEEERKARKEKKRKLAEANGTIPVELVMNGSESSLGSFLAGPGTTKTQVSPTTDPVRIYRRCCQLRETPILKRVTEQLATTTSPLGVVSKLDLTGYWLQLPDLITLGDYLAVVPVKEIVMENCGLTDEGVRVILAGLLAAKCPDYGQRFKTLKEGEVPQGGYVERVVFKNNHKIGRDGWQHICLFINMCRSLKCMDLSQIPFPQPLPATTAQPTSGILGHHLHRTCSATSNPDVSCLLSKALGERLASRDLELLNLAETGMTTEQLGGLIDGAIKSGLRRLGIAGNNITSEGMQHVARFLRDGNCEGLDLGGNDLKDQLGVISDALNDRNGLYALSLADCSLTPDSLWALFPALVKLRNFRFIDLSQNHSLFDTQPSALSLLRRYLPKIPMLKRIHLTDVSMSPEQAIALAEILPESRTLAHVNLMENPKLVALSDAKDEANQEEACALYASLMAAVRVSHTIICIDIEVPSSNSSEVVKALAKQVVAYCLRNMEHGTVAEISEAVAAISEPHGGEKEVAVPDVLLHLVGHIEGFHGDSDESDDEPAPNEDYVIGGSGVVKALGICLRNRGNDSRPSADRTFSDFSDSGSGSATPRTPVSGGKAKDMSKNLLESARKIRARLQPTLLKESRSNDRVNYQRLLFLDQTLEGMIKRFEDEYPETRLPMTLTSPPLPPANAMEQGIVSINHEHDFTSSIETAHLEDPNDAPISDDEDNNALRPMLSRHNSDVSLASRALSEEEGRMHRFGARFRRDILKPDLEDHDVHGTTGSEDTPQHLQMLRAMVEDLGGDEIKSRIESLGQEAVFEELSNEASMLRRRLMEQDPEGWEKFVESQQAALRNRNVSGLAQSCSAIE